MEVARGWGRGNRRRWSRGQAPGVRSPGAEWPAWRLQRTVLFIDLKADKNVDLGGAHHRKEADYAAGWRCQRSLPWSLCHTATPRIHALILISVHLTCLYCPMTIAVKLGKKTSILNNGRRAVYTSYLLSCHQPCRYRKQPVRARPATPRARNLDSARVLRGAPRAGRCYPQLRQSPCWPELPAACVGKWPTIKSHGRVISQPHEGSPGRAQRVTVPAVPSYASPA